MDEKEQPLPVTHKPLKTSGQTEAEPLDYPELLDPPFWGTGEMLVWDSQQLISSVNKEDLFRRRWKGAALTGPEYDRVVVEEYEPRLVRIRKEITDNNLIDARGYYGFFPVYTLNESLFVLDPGDFHSELAEFVFPRVESKHQRSISDYFRPEGDLAAIQIVTLGRLIDPAISTLSQGNDATRNNLFLNALADCITEDLANRVTREIRRGLGIGETGRRFSFGCPGMPVLEEQKQLIRIMGAEERLGLSLTEGFQIVPEHSSIGFFVHHPHAIDF